METTQNHFDKNRRHKIWILVVGFAMIFSSSCRNKQVTADIPSFSILDFQSRDGSFDSKQFHFRVYIPIDRATNEKPAVMLYLHGADDRGDDNQRQLSGLAGLITANPSNFQFIIVFPQCKAGRFWDKEMIAQAMAALDQTVKEFDGDENKLYLSGFSLGGYGAWTTAAMYPGKFAAIVPMSGRILPRSGERKDLAPEIIKLVDAADPYAAFANRIGKTPVWVFHGANDSIVPIDGSRKMVKALKEAGNENVRFSELEDIAHYSLDSAFRDSELFKWLAAQRLNNNS